MKSKKKAEWNQCPVVATEVSMNTILDALKVSLKADLAALKVGQAALEAGQNALKVGQEEIKQLVIKCGKHLFIIYYYTLYSTWCLKAGIKD